MLHIIPAPEKHQQKFGEGSLLLEGQQLRELLIFGDGHVQFHLEMVAGHREEATLTGLLLLLFFNQTGVPEGMVERYGNEEREGSRVRHKITEPHGDNTSNLRCLAELTSGENIRNGSWVRCTGPSRPVFWPSQKHQGICLNRVWLFFRMTSLFSTVLPFP